MPFQNDASESSVSLATHHPGARPGREQLLVADPECDDVLSSSGDEKRVMDVVWE
jgi:hypothetical protein